ncbi:MAG TPA: aspartate aminotransferase family protein [Acidimicrobiaceae bacterium]|nr:aspartate aminotransferase family protein [Acidimicrobiaceae bacterium]
MHSFDSRAERTLELAIDYVRNRLAQEPIPLDHSATLAELLVAAPGLIGEDPVDPEIVFEQYESVIAKAVISADSERFLSFIPSAPTKASCLFDMVVSASALNGTSWLESAGAIYAENQALRVIADQAGFGPDAGGCFVSGGSAGNLSALTVARDVARARRGDRARMRILASAEAHSSIKNTASILDCDIVPVPIWHGRLEGDALRAAAAADSDPDTICAVVATAGTTNAGIIDDLAGAAEVAHRYGWWFHVDAAYGGAGLFAPSVRHRFTGIEQADSMIVDPHKWLFSPLDCAALIYAHPNKAKAVHTQDASYLDSIRVNDAEWNPTDFAYHLSRRARGLATWFSMAVYGLAAYRDAVESSLKTAAQIADRIENSPHLDLICRPDLSIVMFRRRGWSEAEYQDWSMRQLEAGTAFAMPSQWEGEPMMRFAIVNPRTTLAMLDEILDTLG